MARATTAAGDSVKQRSPGVQARASGVNQFSRSTHMNQNSTVASNVIPFRFEKREVRTLIIGDQPWFVASDVASALLYRDAFNMHRNLDDDEKDTQIVSTPGGDQEMLVINQSGLYSAILRSRKAEAKRFKKWVTAEVLPAIRKHGRYIDNSNKMATLVDELIGMTEVNVIKGLIRDKAKVIPIDRRRSFQLTMHKRLHTRFNVPRVELIPAQQFEAACNFVASYALEGEWLPARGVADLSLSDDDLAYMYAFCANAMELVQVGEKLGPAMEALGSVTLLNVPKSLNSCRVVVAHLHRRFGERMEEEAKEQGIFINWINLAAAGDRTQSIYLNV